MFGNRNKNDRHQARFLSEVTGDFGYDALALGERDLCYGLPFLQEMMEKYDLPFTNANVRNAATTELILPEFLVVERNGIKFGICSVLSPEFQILTLNSRDPGLEVLDPIAVLRDLLPRLRKEADSIIVLSHLGDAATDDMIREVAGIDLVVTGHTSRSLKTEKVVNKTAVITAVREGQYIGRCESFINDKTGQVMAFDVMLQSLDDSIESAPDLLARVKEYKESLQAFKLETRARYPRNLGSEKEKFLGATVCKSCHADAWQAYVGSGHMRAMSSVRDSGRNFDPGCVVCHVTGYQWQNGYRDQRPYNQLANVQCEACHGYGTQHARDGKWGSQAKDSCAVCHDEENSPEFDYVTYWEKIKH